MLKPIYKIMIFLKRRPGLSIEDFRDYYENHHVPLCLKYAAGLKRYARHYPTLVVADADELGFDVITELCFEDKTVFELVLDYGSRGQLPADVIADEERVFDRAKTRYTSVVEYETVVEYEAVVEHETVVN